MGIEDIQISEELETNAPSIKYSGNEGPKSPQEMEQMMMAQLEEEYLKYVDDMMEQGLEPMTLEQFMQQAMAEGQMAGGNPLPQDPTKPVNPFQPKPTGPVLPDRQMAAYGGIMGMDGRKQYGIGSWFQGLKDKVVDDIIPNEIKDNKGLAAAAALVGANYLDVPLPGGGSTKGYIGDLFSNLPESVKKAPGKLKEFIFNEDDEGDSIAKNIGSSLAKNIVPILGGVTAGLFTKNTESDTPGLPSDNTALNLAELKKGANLSTQKQAMAGGLNFTPAVSARKYSPEEMAITYAQAANGGRIGYQNAGPVLDQQTTQMILDMHGRGMDIDTIQTITQQDPNAINAIINSQNLPKQMPREMAEGGIMDLGGMEKDYRAEGGFVPIGREEKADDVPARLSVNEFVFTADAVRNAGGGDIDQGAKVMENMMKHLEQGGQVSEESQGMAGARDMFETSERLSEVIMAIEQVQNLPQQYVTDLGVDYGKQLAGLTSIPLDTARLAPEVAGQDPLQTQAYNLAGSGVGAYQPYLTQQAAYSGPQAYQSFASPYQQDVIDATLSEFDKQTQAGLTGIGQNAAMSGNLGGGREGVMRANYMSDQDANRALILAKLNQQGFNQANLNAQTAFNQQGTLAGNIQDFQTADINQLGRLGGLQQAQTQAGLDATREANRLEAFEPYERLGTYGSGVASLFSGNAPFGNQSTITPNPTPLQTALGTASVLSGIFGGGTSRTAEQDANINRSDIQLKKDIKLVGKSPSGLNVYNFKYIGEDETYQGVMAQEVPWAASVADNGYLQVDYSKVDVDFKKVN